VRSARPFSSSVHVDISALTHTGHRRPNNEDQFFVAKATRALETLMTSLPPGDVPDRTDELNYVMVVADGMGGHAAGEVASRLTITSLVALALQIPDWILRADPGHTPEIERRAREAIQQVGSMLVERGRQDASLRGMGSTLTGARSFGRELMIVHVGDSRAYLLRAGQLQRLTRDHTYAQMMADAGYYSSLAKSTFRVYVTSSPTCSADLSMRSMSTSICWASKTAIVCCSVAMDSPTVWTTI
jgi:protein phosphatase